MYRFYASVDICSLSPQRLADHRSRFQTNLPGDMIDSFVQSVDHSIRTVMPIVFDTLTYGGLSREDICKELDGTRIMTLFRHFTHSPENDLPCWPEEAPWGWLGAYVEDNEVVFRFGSAIEYTTGGRIKAGVMPQKRLDEETYDIAIYFEKPVDSTVTNYCTGESELDLDRKARIISTF